MPRFTVSEGTRRVDTRSARYITSAKARAAREALYCIYKEKAIENDAIFRCRPSPPR